MTFFQFLFSLSLAHASEFPACDNLFSELDAIVENPAADVDAAKKTLFKIANDKRTEVVRYVRTAKDELRKAKDQELKNFDAESKKNKPSTPEAKATARATRSALITKIGAEKKDFNRDVSEKEKACNKYLSERREHYLAQLRSIKQGPKQTLKTTKDKTLIPEMESEFDTIPKGPGIVLKPQ